jgi:site-specific DNA-methyltransferase (adenine-specific)
MKIHGLNRINLVLDPFLGIGNTAVACKKLGKSFVGFEIDAGYLETAVWNVDRA